MSVLAARRLNELEVKNTKVTRRLAEAHLDIRELKTRA
jgi:hypothetical protein